jgi:hypothetical protein
LHALYPTQFNLVATRGSIGSTSVWQAIRDGAAPQAAQAFDDAAMARFARMREESLRY